MNINCPYYLSAAKGSSLFKRTILKIVLLNYFMEIIRSSKHILKYQNKHKTELLNKLYSDYMYALQYYVDLIWEKKLPLEKRIPNAQLIPIEGFVNHSSWLRVLYGQASQIIRSNKRKLDGTKPVIKSCKIPIIGDLWSPEKNAKYESKYFDEFLSISLMHFTGTRAPKLRLPIKYHKHSKKFSSWKRASECYITKEGNNFYMNFSYKKEIEPKENQNSIGIDLGYKKLAVVSNGQIVGKDFEKICTKISKKKRNSKAYKKALSARNNYLNQELKKIDLNNVGKVYAEDLLYVKHRTKQQKRIATKFMNKLQYWTYSKALRKLENICEEHGITLEKVSPEYTSQQCSSCGHIDKRSRNGEHYHCVSCGLSIDADLNAAINIHNIGVFRPFD